jgi:hypothetical protein
MTVCRFVGSGKEVYHLVAHRQEQVRGRMIMADGYDLADLFSEDDLRLLADALDDGYSYRAARDDEESAEKAEQYAVLIDRVGAVLQGGPPDA